ncbi:MAG: glycosyltransferase family 2 protein [Chitinophagaceae bacterium]
MKKVSVIIPTYKRPELLSKCLTALINQTFNKNDYEIIVVTDGPDEETVKGIKNLKLKIKSIEHQISNIKLISLREKRGPAAARNAGWQSASSELILFTDDDCVPSKNWIESYWNVYIDQQQKEVAFTGKIKVPLSKKPTDYERNTANLETADFVTANCACTKTALQKVNGFDENYKMAWREDSDLEFKLLKNNIPIKKNYEAFVIHPVRKAAWGVSLKEQKKSMFNALLYKKFPDLYRKKIYENPLWNYYAMIVLITIACISFFKNAELIAIISLSIWLVLLFQFTYKRLKGASKKISHVIEMVLTSIFIPFYSVYWTLYGAVKFKVLFL